MEYKIGKVLISKEEIQNRIKELAEEIKRDYAGKTLVCICVLRGASVFMTDLVRAIGAEVDVRMDFMAISSYGISTKSSGVVKIQKDLTDDIHGQHVLIVEDIVDTGLSLSYLRNLLEDRNPASVKVCVLLDKIERRVKEVEVEYTGFKIPNEFVIGYGLDCAEKFRQLDQIHVAVPDGE